MPFRPRRETGQHPVAHHVRESFDEGGEVAYDVREAPAKGVAVSAKPFGPVGVTS